MKKEKFSYIAPLSEAVNHELVSHLGTITSQCERFLLGLKEGIYKNKSEREIIEKAEEIMRINLKAASSAHDAIRRISDYIKDIRKASLKDIDVREAMDKALFLLRADIKRFDIEVKKKFPKRLSKINATPFEIQELFLIIITNAVEAIEEKGRGSIFVKVIEKKEEISIEIKDTGCGMSDQVLKRIFKPFSTAGFNESKEGLGLFIAHEIMYSLNGSISCESKLGRGSSFRLRFPK